MHRRRFCLCDRSRAVSIHTRIRSLHTARYFIDYLSLSRNSDAQRRDAHLERFMCAHFEKSEYVLFRGIKVFCSPAELHI